MTLESHALSTAPLCSSATFDALVVIGLLTMLLLLAIAWIFQAYRRARLGGRLLAACRDDYSIAHAQVNEIARLDAIIRFGMQGIRDDVS